MGDSLKEFKKDFSNVARLLTRKSECWSYEEEWRIIRPLEEARKVPRDEKIYYALSAEKEHISHIVFGVNSTSAFRSEMVAWLGETSARIQIVTIDPETNVFSLRDAG